MFTLFALVCCQDYGRGVGAPRRRNDRWTFNLDCGTWCFCWKRFFLSLPCVCGRFLLFFWFTDTVFVHRGNVMVGVTSGVFGALLGGWIQSKRGASKTSKDAAELIRYIQLQDELFKTKEAQWKSDYQKLYKVLHCTGLHSFSPWCWCCVGKADCVSHVFHNTFVTFAFHCFHLHHNKRLVFVVCVFDNCWYF